MTPDEKECFGEQLKRIFRIRLLFDFRCKMIVLKVNFTLNEILLPFPSNSGSMTAILLIEITLSDDTNIPIQSTTTTDSSTASNDDRNYPSQLETKQIYDIEDKFELNYKRLHDDLKKINYEQVNKEEKSLIKQMSDIEIQLQKTFTTNISY
ncbi:unnamed protein product [Rotaria magnacalcarata]|uniref:Uncharacterized protein n=3 Tax=Rotaria magnacalcarata TaxID=392030 RepID=A0A815I1H3_9BILA|nr:unnamed protein product [Rotaria magnacalcarata]